MLQTDKILFLYALSTFELQIGDGSDDSKVSANNLSPAKYSGTSDYGTCTCSGSGGVGDARGCNSVRTWTDSSSCHGDYNSDSELSVGSDDSTPNYEDLSTLRHTTSTDSDDDDSYFERYVYLEIYQYHYFYLQ